MKDKKIVLWIVTCVCVGSIIGLSLMIQKKPSQDVESDELLVSADDSKFFEDLEESETKTTVQPGVAIAALPQKVSGSLKETKETSRPLNIVKPEILDEAQGVLKTGELAKDTQPKYNCVQASLSAGTEDKQGAVHEFRLPHKVKSKDSICMWLGKETVPFTHLADDVVRIDWKFVRDDNDVRANFCVEGEKCKLKCPEPEKNFWDALYLAQNETEDSGFLEVDSVETKELQKELKALKVVLNRKPSRARVVNWKITESKEMLCQ